MSIVSVTKVFNEQLFRNTSGLQIHEYYRVEVDTFDSDIGLCVTAVDPNTSLAIPGAGATRTVLVEGAVSITLGIFAVEPERREKLVFIVRAIWAPLAGTSLGTSTSSVWEVDFSVRCVPVIVTASKDVDGNVITNSAMEPVVSDALKTTKYDEEITVTFKTLTPPISAIADKKGDVNVVPCAFTINGITKSFDTKTLKFTYYEYSTVRGETLYWKVTLKFVWREDSWIREFVDEGTYYLDSAGNHIPPPTGSKCLLDGIGGLLPANTDPNVIDVEIDLTADFTSLFAGL